MDKLESKIQLLTDSDAVALARSYDVLAYARCLRAMLNAVLPDYDFSQCDKYQLHKAVDRILVSKHRGEAVLKGALVRKFLEENVTVAFETRVNSSRVDFLAVNGDTKSYEIKSGVDNLMKLAKQVRDYSSVFEYNNVVIDERHLSKASEIIPANYGIWLAADGLHLHEARRAKLNKSLDVEKQLSLFTKKELNRFFVPGTCAEEVMVNFTEGEVNAQFKKMLKSRYTKRWDFLKLHEAEILSVDYQFFFQHNVRPAVIYQTAS